jgi:hypothetical protein
MAGPEGNAPSSRVLEALLQLLHGPKIRGPPTHSAIRLTLVPLLGLAPRQRAYQARTLLLHHKGMKDSKCAVGFGLAHKASTKPIRGY